MSNSNLVSYIDSGSSNYNERTGPISKITIHHAAGKLLTLQQFSNIMHSPNREVSWNYAIAYDGSIGLFIPEKYRAWTTSNRDNDMIAITIEVSNSTNDEPWPISNESYKSLINLCEDICRRNNIKAIQYTGDKSGNLTMHKWFASTGCPGPTLSTKFPEIMQEVNKRLGQPSTLQYITNPITGEVTAAGFGQSASIISVESLIDYSAFTPYVATIDRSVKSVDFKKLKKAGVSVVMIEAGRLYNDSHHEMSNYMNPLLDKQVIDAGKASIDYGLIADVRARTVAEANKELKELTRVIQKYTPPYGVWLNLNLSTANKAINNKIIDRYEFVLQSLGLKDKIGFYATRKQLKRIDWTEKRQNVWYLWLNEHVKDKDHLSQLLSPEFFMTDASKASDIPVINTTIYAGGTTTNSTSTYADWVFVGDSRTVGLGTSVKNLDYIAKVGAGYTFLSAQLANIKKYHNKNVVFWFGVNDLGNIDNYIKTYNELYTSMTDCKIIVATVGPTCGNYAKLMPDIQDFNAALKQGLNPGITVVDVFSEMTKYKYTSPDGLHYNSKTYELIYNFITEGKYGD